MKKYKMVGGAAHGVTLQTETEIKVRLYYNGNLYWVTGEFDGDYEILRWAPIKPRSVNEVQD